MGIKLLSFLAVSGHFEQFVLVPAEYEERRKKEEEKHIRSRTKRKRRKENLKGLTKQLGQSEWLPLKGQGKKRFRNRRERRE